MNVFQLMNVLRSQLGECYVICQDLKTKNPAVMAGF